MNKTRKRAIQKHRAKAVKYTARRKGDGDNGGARSKQSFAAASSGAKPRQAGRRREATEEPEE